MRVKCLRNKIGDLGKSKGPLAQSPKSDLQLRQDACDSAQGVYLAVRQFPRAVWVAYLRAGADRATRLAQRSERHVAERAWTT